MYKIFRSIIFFLIIGSKIFAQDVHFSQFYNSPLTLNPSQTGDFNGDWRISTNYRTQWGAIANKPYESYSLGFDKPEYYYTQKISWGIIAVRDQSFLNLNTTKLFGSVSSGIEINKHQIILGVQFGIVNKTTDFSAYSFDSQFDLGGSSVFNPSFSNREDAEEGIYYFDMNAGVQWSKKLSEKFKPMVGLAFFHLTNPVESFTSMSEEDATIGLRTNFHLGGQFKSTSKLTLHPLMIYTQQKNATDWMLGGNAELHLAHNVFKSIYGGTLFRYGWNKNYDASIWIVGTKFNNFDLGISYDINVSSLSKATNFRGAFEISLIYITSSSKPDKIQIPCDRF